MRVLAILLIAATASAAKSPVPRAVALHVLYFAPSPIVPLEKALPFCSASAGGTPVVPPQKQDDAAAASITVVRYPADRAPHLEDALIDQAGVEVSPADKVAIARTVDPILVRMSAPLGEASRSLHDVEKLVTCLSDSMQALVWDDAAKVLYGRATFRRLRLDAWTTDEVPLGAEINLRQVAHGDGVRSMTFGLNKVGLPDLIVDSHPQFLAAAIGALMNQVAVSMVASPRTLGAGKIAVKGVTIPFVAAKRENGDPDGAIVGLSLGDATQQAALLARISGAKPEKEVVAMTDDPELDAVRAKAQARLAQLAGELRPNPPAGTLLAVKSRFTAEDGRVEFMWVEVKHWETDELTGILQNDPFYAKSLHAGDQVTVDQGDVADYVYKRRGKPSEGGESDQIIESRTKKSL